MRFPETSTESRQCGPSNSTYHRLRYVTSTEYSSLLADADKLSPFRRLAVLAGHETTTPLLLQREFDTVRGQLPGTTIEKSLMYEPCRADPIPDLFASDLQSCHQIQSHEKLYTRVQGSGPSSTSDYNVQEHTEISQHGGGTLHKNEIFSWSG